MWECGRGEGKRCLWWGGRQQADWTREGMQADSLPTALPQGSEVSARMVEVRVEDLLAADLRVPCDTDLLRRRAELKSVPARQVRVRGLCARPLLVHWVAHARNFVGARQNGGG